MVRIGWLVVPRKKIKAKKIFLEKKEEEIGKRPRDGGNDH